MRIEIFTIIAAVGVFVWALRVLPLWLDFAQLPRRGGAARFMAATGVAAIATLFASAMLPEITPERIAPALMGSLAVIAVYLPSQSVVMATMAGAAAYGAAFSFWG